MIEGVGESWARFRLTAAVAASCEQEDTAGRVISGVGTMHGQAFIIAAVLILTPLGARAADLVVWWEKGQAAEEDEAVKEIVAAFEEANGNQVELVLGPQEELVGELVTALEARRQTPDFVFTVVDTQPYERWAYEGRLVIDDPDVRRRLVQALDSYTAIYRKGCTPPDSVTWDGYGNNSRFLAQSVVMTPNQTLSTVNPLKRERPEDYHNNAVTVGWPSGAYGQPLVIETFGNRAAVFKDGEHVPTAKEFVRFLVGEGWLAHYLNFSGERMLPPMPKLLDQPFWLDPSDPHRMRSAMQLLSQPRSYDYVAVSGDWRHTERNDVWPEAVHRIVTDGITPEQAVDEAIARIKQVLSE